MAAVDSFALLLKEVGRSCSHYTEVLALVGVCYATKTCFTVLSKTYSLIRVHFVSRLVGRADLAKLYGKWAVVTGCTSGLGRSYAKELAKRGINVILISRSREKLDAVAREIRESYGVETAIIVADFSQGRKIYPAIEQALHHREIGILVNNVGVFYDYPNYFVSLTQEKIWQLISVNIEAATMMAFMVLPGMIERRKGAIVNVSSMACIKPYPLIAAYSASKVYLDHFSRALHYEYASHGIFVQSLIPGFISTNMIGWLKESSKESFWMPSPDEYARHAIATLGVSNRTAGYWPHSLLFLFTQYLPEWFSAWGSNIYFNYYRKMNISEDKRHKGTN